MNQEQKIFVRLIPWLLLKGLLIGFLLPFFCGINIDLNYQLLFVCEILLIFFVLYSIASLFIVYIGFMKNLLNNKIFYLLSTLGLMLLLFFSYISLKILDLVVQDPYTYYGVHESIKFYPTYIVMLIFPVNISLLVFGVQKVNKIFSWGLALINLLIFIFIFYKLNCALNSLYWLE